MEGEDGGLSAGRSRRSTAGNRMRELLEQERERLEAKRGNEDDEMFQEEEGDVDFEAKVEDVEDIIDSDFDQSSDDADEGDDELEGEREIEEEEKAAKKASRVKAAPIGVRKTVAPKVAQADGQTPSAKPKRISFAAGTSTNHDGVQRSSKRKSTIDATQSVQARMKIDEQRRQELIDRAAPKRKKVRLSQADRIAEALEMEEQNRESLKRFLELEEERRERDRRRSKKGIEGPFLRFHSVAEDRNAHLRVKMIDQITGAKEAAKEMAASTRHNLTDDPVHAARDAAKKERENREAREMTANDEIDKVSEIEAPDQLALDVAAAPAGTDDVLMETSERKTASTIISSSEAPEPGVENHVLNTPPVQLNEIQRKGEPETAGGNIKEQLADTTHEARIGAEFNEVELTKASLDESNLPIANAEESREERTTLSTPEKDEIVTQVEEDHPEVLETRTYISLHQLAPESSWHLNWSYVLGSHVDWSCYPLVPARNRPLRPRQSVCPVTGLPAVYKDPRSGIAYANKEAYQILTKVISGQYLWSSQPTVSSDVVADQQSSVNTNYEPLQMGCWLDDVNEAGACNAITLATNKIVARQDPAFRPKGAIAPGDEQALVAAAQALPAGTTRSGIRRAASGSAQVP